MIFSQIIKIKVEGVVVVKKSSKAEQKIIKLMKKTILQQKKLSLKETIWFQTKIDKV